jgi:hypothetical protein
MEQMLPAMEAVQAVLVQRVGAVMGIQLAAITTLAADCRNRVA